MKYQDKELITKYNENKNEIFEEIYYKYKNLIYYMARRVARCKADADDLVQEIFMKISENMHTFNDNYASFKTWIVSIAKNHTVDYIKSKQHIILNNDIVYSAIDVSSVVDNKMFDCLENNLSEKELEFLVLKIAFGFTHRELAEVYDMTIDMSKKFLKSTKTKAKEEWKKYEKSIR